MASRLYAYTIRRTLRIIGIILFSLAVVALLAWGITQGFTIRQVAVDGQGVEISFDKSKLGENLLFLQTDRLTKELLSQYPLLSGVEFEKRYPGTLIIHLIKRKPFVLLESRTIRYLLDADGYVLDNATGDEPLPALHFDAGLLSIGARVPDSRIRSSLTFLTSVPKTIQIRDLSEADSTSILATLEETRIFLPQSGDMRAKATTLQAIVEGFRIKGILPTVIDLRFTKPIITN